MARKQDDAGAAQRPSGKESWGDHLRDSQAVARRIDVAARTLEHWRRKRKGPAFVRIGTIVRYKECDVDAWIAAQGSIGGAQ